MSARRPRQRGIAAVELALLMPTFILLLALPLFLGRALYQYQLMHKAAHSAARYLSSCASFEMKSPARLAEISATAQALAQAGLAGISAGSFTPVIGINCDGGPCSGLLVPTTISVTIVTQLEDNVFPYAVYNQLGRNGMPLTVTATMRYVGY